MTQTSGPRAFGTDAERQFSDVMWRDLFGDEPGIVGDVDGSAYGITLSTNSDVATLVSGTQDSRSIVGGFGHKIVQGAGEGVTIPPAVGAARTDIIAVRYDPAYADSPGPCRLVVITGTSSAIPSFDASPPGVEDLPLWAVTRTPSQALSQATVTDLRTRIGRLITVPDGASLPPSAPIGTNAWWRDRLYRRQLSSSTPAWVLERGPYATAAGSIGVGILQPGQSGQTTRIIYPAGRFTVLPVLTLACMEVRYNAGIVHGTATTEGVTLYVGNWSNAAPGLSASNLNIHWTATQMTPTSAAG